MFASRFFDYRHSVRRQKHDHRGSRKHARREQERLRKNARAKTAGGNEKNLHGILNIQASIHGAGLPETRQQSVPSRPHSPQQCPHSSMPCTCKTSLFSCSKLLSRHTLFLYWPVSGCAFGREGVFKQKTGNEEQVAAWLRIAPKQMWWLLAEMEGWIWLWLGQACG